MSRNRSRAPVRATIALALLAAVPAGCRCSDPSSPLVQDFEGRSGLGKWPEDAPGKVERSSDWKADGESSLRIDPGLLATTDSLRRTDFRGFDALRVRVNNTSKRLAVIGFELSDDHRGLYDRHRTAFGAPPGESTIDLDISGDLWRGEENRPYRGSQKTPLDRKDISRIGFSNQGDATVYIDALTLVKNDLPVPPGAWAFDFGKRGSRVMDKTTGVFEDTVFDPAAGFGFVDGKPSALRNFMSYPTPLLGDGLAWEDAVFQVNLEGGSYTGWIAFERGGFYEEEATGYSSATLRINGKTAEHHEFSPSDPHFLFQDTEVTRVADIVEKLVLPAHAVDRFTFEAVPGPNTFSLRVHERVGPPLRVAGLFLAPDGIGKGGQDFITALERRQTERVLATFPERDEARRPDNPAPLDYPLIVEPRPLGEVAHPRDLPRAPIADVTPVQAIAGHRAHVQLSLYAPGRLDVAVHVAASGDATLPSYRALYGNYLPKRPYGIGAAWIETHDYRPVPANGTIDVGPDLSRSVLLEFDVPQDAPAGAMELTAVFSVKGESLVELPIPLVVHRVDLPPLPIPVGLFMSGLPLGPETLGEDRWWQLQEELLATMGEAGLNTPTGGPGLEFTMSETGSEYTFSGKDALRYLDLAKKHGVDRAVVCYSGFLHSIKHRRPDAGRFQRSWKAFEEAHALPPHYLYSYDEPSTPDELAAVADYLGPFLRAGARTIGFLSHADEDRYRAVLDSTFAPAVSGHTEALLRRWIGEKRHVFVYNRGTSRLSMGADLHRQIRLGVAGRLEWIGLYTQGFAFDDLDGREPSYAMFAVHRWLGILPTPRWLSLREGLIDARIRLALDRALAPGEAGPAWPDEYPADPKKWPDGALDRARLEALERLSRK